MTRRDRPLLPEAEITSFFALLRAEPTLLRKVEEEGLPNFKKHKAERHLCLRCGRPAVLPMVVLANPRVKGRIWTLLSDGKVDRWLDFCDSCMREALEHFSGSKSHT